MNGFDMIQAMLRLCLVARELLFLRLMVLT